MTNYSPLAPRTTLVPGSFLTLTWMRRRGVHVAA